VSGSEEGGVRATYVELINRLSTLPEREEGEKNLLLGEGDDSSLMGQPKKKKKDSAGGATRGNRGERCAVEESRPCYLLQYLQKKK